MIEYIERETLKKRFEKRLNWLKKDIHDEYSGALYDGCGTDAELIDEIPAADVVPVVRCKDCKNKGWVQEPCRGKSVDYCKVWDCTLRNLKTTFCSYGERKEVNNES